jgi:HSP20 family protein
MARLPNLFPSGSPMGFGGGDPFLTLYRQMNRLFDDALRGGLGPSGAQGGSQGGLLLAPDVDVNETDTEVRVTAELPGVSEQDIEVSLREDVLTIRAEKRQERQEERRGVHVSERAYGTFQRELRLPVPVNPDQVQARFENGVLTVTLPKTQPQERSRRIQVRGGQGQSRIEQDQPGQGGTGSLGQGQQKEGKGQS